MTFIKKRKITDAVSMANKRFDRRRRQGEIGLSASWTLHCWALKGISKLLKKIWNTIPACVCRVVWKERNDKNVLNGKQIT